MNIVVVRAESLDGHLNEADAAVLGTCSLPVGFPFLVDQDSQKLVEPVLLYLWSRHLRSGRYVPNTAIAMADDLRDWWVFLSYYSLDWDVVGRADFEHYRDAMLRFVSPHTHEAYSAKTIRRRLSSILSFYRYAVSRGWVAVDFDFQERVQISVPIDRDVLAHVSSSKAKMVSTLMRPDRTAPDDEVKVFTAKQYRAVAHQLGPLPDAVKEDPRLVRNRLWAELCLHTGMRPEEPARLTVHSILDLSPQDPDDPYGICYLRIKGKGGKTRKVALPNLVLKWLIWYIDSERKEAIAAGRHRGNIGEHREPVALFLNSPMARHNAGKAMSYDTFLQAFTSALRAAASRHEQSLGLLRTTFKTDPTNNRDYLANELAFTPHCLRHTYAVWTYLAEKRQGNPEPWKLIQSRLGHAHLSTTLDIYLRTADSFEAEISDRYVSHIESLLCGGV